MLNTRGPGTTVLRIAELEQIEETPAGSGERWGTWVKDSSRDESVRVGSRATVAGSGNVF